MRVDGDSLLTELTLGRSRITSRVRLVDDRVEIEADIDWHEREQVLKAAFDVDVHTDHAAYETQFGHVVRPTHENTTWDAARFEVCAHRWVHVGEAGYGVGLANDATYGHDVTRHPRDGGGTYSRVRLSLLRAPLFPDPETDQGRHVLRYALVPGAGIAEAAEAGYALNLPLRRRTGSPVEPLVSVDGTAYVEAVKLAADGSGDVVVRLYEPLGARTQVRVSASFEHASVTEVDLLERPLDTGSWDGERLHLAPSRSSPCASASLVEEGRSPVTKPRNRSADLSPGLVTGAARLPRPAVEVRRWGHADSADHGRPHRGHGRPVQAQAAARPAAPVPDRAAARPPGRRHLPRPARPRLVSGVRARRRSTSSRRSRSRRRTGRSSRSGCGGRPWETGPDGLKAVVDEADEAAGSDRPRDRLHYLSVPPKAALDVVQILKEADLVSRSRIIMEKPFGTDLASSKALNKELHRVFKEDQIFRIDHFLGKEAAQNILAFRFANGLFEPIWHRNHIDHIQIDVPESLGLEQRASFYEATGAYRDMVVTHLFQVLAFTAMEPPTALEPFAISEEKNKVFRSMLPIEPHDVVRGQYVGYRDIDGVAPESETETFVALKCYVDNWRWAGVPFYLRTGKRMAEGARIISIAFREPPRSMFPPHSGVGDHGPDHLTFDLADQAKMSLSFYGKKPGPGMQLQKLSMQFAMRDTTWAGAVLEAYERLIYDAARGDRTLFTSAEGIERLWEVSQPLLENPPVVRPYNPGSWGPNQIHQLVAPFAWRLPFERQWRDPNDDGVSPGPLVEEGRRPVTRPVRARIF